MEDKKVKKLYKHDDIPVIHFNHDSGAWEATGSESKQSRTAAVYKNQLDNIARAKAVGSTGLYESRAMRSERAAAAAAERNKKRGRLPGGFAIHIFIALALFIAVWLMLK